MRRETLGVVMLSILMCAATGGCGSSKPDDPYEPNDIIAEAWDFTGGAGQWLSVYGGAKGRQWDDDWYEIFVPSGETLLTIDCTFTHAEGDIDLELYDEFGMWVDDSWSADDNEQIVVDVALEGYPSGGTFHVLVYWGNEGNEYDLMWDVATP